MTFSIDDPETIERIAETFELDKEKHLRVGLAHELGHLYLCTLFDKDPNEAPPEPLSSVFGVLAILQKTDFYKKNPINMEFNPRTPEKVLSMFSLLNNKRRKGKYNIS